MAVCAGHHVAAVPVLIVVVLIQTDTPMYLARSRGAPHLGVDPRILVSDDPKGGWIDVRHAEALRLQRHGATDTSAWRLAGAIVPSSMSEALSNGDSFWEAVSHALDETSGDAHLNSGITLTNAIDPVSYRDFMTFEDHFRAGYIWLDTPVPEVMYQLPVSYCGNAASFIGTGDTVRWPAYSTHLDYELELGIVISRPGTDLTPETALDHVAGLTILNDFSARDIQAREMPAALGPSKSKHFASATGPYLTPLDSMPDADLYMEARVNGELWSRSNASEMIWSIAELVAWTSQGETLQPGMLLGSGTCNRGCTVEIGKTLQPGDTVELRATGLGSLTNFLGKPDTGGWTPSPRSRGGTHDVA